MEKHTHGVSNEIYISVCSRDSISTINKDTFVKKTLYKPNTNAENNALLLKYCDHNFENVNLDSTTFSICGHCDSYLISRFYNDSVDNVQREILYSGSITDE